MLRFCFRIVQESVLALRNLYFKILWQSQDLMARLWCIPIATLAMNSLNFKFILHQSLGRMHPWGWKDRRPGILPGGLTDISAVSHQQPKLAELFPYQMQLSLPLHCPSLVIVPHPCKKEKNATFDLPVNAACELLQVPSSQYSCN